MWRCTALATAYSRDALRVGDDDYGTKLKQDLARMGVDISHVHTKHGVTAQTQVELHDNDRVFGDYTEGVMADFALSEEDYAAGLV